MKPKDITGQRFGRLTAIRRAPPLPGYGQARWLFKCDCGSDYEQFGYVVWHGKVVSCGCRLREIQAAGMRRRHGMAGSPTFIVWAGMRQRCNNPNSRAYKDYGGRGIRVCARWQTFENFLADMGERPAGMSLDRADNNGHYEPQNCRWTTKVAQVRNRRTTAVVVWRGKRRPLQEHCADAGLPYKTIWVRYQQGQRGDKLFRPLRGTKRMRSRPS